ncbi:MAG TPA: DUF1801 domain-containing protein [Chryseolinea sp.]|nr:DUF1801 domain-containing protein [Chryseolinea sp.]HPH45987.1 DUF1801 domain-containing protein [Chryseolinea sp.]HPM30665.1 DUF1801 domain-containing protein [Chryseolinea sp.]
MSANSKSVEELIMSLPRDEQVLVKRLRSLITECIPKATEQVYYDMGLPFYRHNKLICFIWPASVFWGSRRRPETQNAKGTSLGFNQGYLMANEDGVLKSEGRKQVYVMYFKSIKDLDENKVRALLFEAAMIDDEFPRRKRNNSNQLNR